jgi:hypothetical protein
MGSNRALRAACVLLLAAPGCTTLREIPRAEYADAPERRNVRLVTQTGLEYEFDVAAFGPDSMTGYRRRDQEGPLEDYVMLSLPYGEVRTLALRKVDWYRTGLIGGGVVAAVVVAGLSTSGRDDESGSGGTGGRPPGIP